MADNKQHAKSCHCKDCIWDDDALQDFRNTFSGSAGKNTFVNLLFELGFFDDEVGRNTDGNVTLESAIEGNVKMNLATTLLRRLAFNREDEFSNMLAGLLKGVKPVKKEKQDG